MINFYRFYLVFPQVRKVYEGVVFRALVIRALLLGIVWGFQRAIISTGRVNPILKIVIFVQNLGQVFVFLDLNVIFSSWMQLYGPYL